MSNRFFPPVGQWSDDTGVPYASGNLYFYLTGTTTPTDTYSNSTLLTANANPVPLNARGEPTTDIFLDPATTYKCILKDSSGNSIRTWDPVVDPAANVTAAFQVYAGNPNGNVAGSAGAVGGAGASVIWDITNLILYICTTTGTSSTAVWTNHQAVMSGSIIKSSVITPTTLAANTDNWAPTGGSAASIWRIAASAAYNLTGISISQAAGQELILHNIGAENITLVNNATSTAANRFQSQADVVLKPEKSVLISYDATTQRWRIVDPGAPPASDTVAGVIELAIQSEMETGTDVSRAVVPGRQHFHPGHPKCWALVTVSGGTPTLYASSFNITSITDSGAGDLTITIATDFSSANWACLATVENLDATVDTDTDKLMVMVGASLQAAGTVRLLCGADSTSGAWVDPGAWHMVGFGDQA